MGVNYYVKISRKQKDKINADLEICSLIRQCIDNYELHIGKLSAGLPFIFQLHKEVYFKGGHIDLDTYGKWKDFISQDTLEIWNEYNELIDKNDFFKMIDESKNNKMKEYDSEHIHTHYLHDLQGWRFLEGDFS